MLTLLLILIPLISGFILLFTGSKNARQIALVLSLIEFGLALFALNILKSGTTESLSYSIPWIPSMGISFHLGMDGISMLMVLLSTLLMPLIIYSSFNKTYSNSHNLYALMFIMQSAMVGSFAAMDGFLFYIFWEVSLIPIFFIILMWGGENRQKTTFKFFIYTLFGSLFMLLALIYLYLHTSTHSFDIQALYAAGRSLSLTEQGLIMGAFFLAFAIKMPIFPFHTWQPSTYVAAPTPGVMLLGGVMSKMATYGLIRWVLPMVPDGVQEYGYLIIRIHGFKPYPVCSGG
jgi:NADH-quinone oxidoreductase subunit M